MSIEVIELWPCYRTEKILLSHGKGKNDLCMVVYLYPINEFNEWFFRKGSGNTDSGHPIGMHFLVVQRK